MPIKEALFWIGLTVFGTGLYFMIDKAKHLRWLAIIVTVAGAAALGYSIYAHYSPDAPKLPVWLYLLSLTWLLVGADIYFRRRDTQATRKTGADWREAFRDPRFSLVNDHKYENDSIQVDGKSFRRCSFKNVTFNFQGNAPFEFVEETHLDAGSVRFVTDNPAIILYNEMTRKFEAIASEAIAAGRAKVETGALDAKGHEVPLRLPTVQRLEPTEADPRIYLLDIKSGGDHVFPKSLFVIKNGGGNVAHRIQIESLVFGYKVVTFPTTDNLGVGLTAEVEPTIQEADLNKHWIIPVLIEALNATGMKDNGEDFLNFPFTVNVTCESFDGKRKIRTSVELTFSYIHYKWSSEGKAHRNVFDIKKTTFTLLS